MIRVGIVGTGLIAGEHADAIALIAGEAQLVAAADTAAERLADFGRVHHVTRLHASADDLIADPEVDLVTVATPPSTHEAVVVAALDAGKYVLCEKPLAHSLASAERIAAAEARHPGRLSVSYQLRYLPAYRRMLWLVRNGWIGDVQHAVVERHGYIPHGSAGRAGWWGAWDVAGGGVLITQMIHELDIMLQAMGAPREVTARIDTRYTAIESEDWVEADIGFDGGRTARCAGSVNSGQMRGGLSIRGSLGAVTPAGLTLDDPARAAAALAAVNAALPDTRPASMSLPARALRKIGRRLGATPAPTLTAHAELYRDIARSIGAGAALPIPSAEALASSQLCAAIYESAIFGERVALPLDASARTHGGVSGASYGSRARVARERPAAAALPKSRTVRVGLIGCDTTHATTFADLLHNPYNPDHIPGAVVAAAYPGGSPDMPISISRVDGFTAELRDKYKVPIVETPEAAADAADVVLILSCDGRTHPGLFRAVADRGKPIFVDKPLAISLADAELISQTARTTGARVMACSAYRYADGLTAALAEIRAAGETIKSCQVRYWGQIQPTQGRLFWYGIHGAEMLTAVMGQGATSVSARTEGVKDVVDVAFADGRTATLVGDQSGEFHVSIETSRRTLEIPIGGPVSARLLAAALDVLTPGGYPRLWRATDAGSVSRRAGKPLDPELPEALAVVSILDAAQRSLAARETIAL